MKLVLMAGTMSFGNEWLQKRQVNWRVPIATVVAAAATAGLGRVSPGAATGLGVMALLAAAVTPLNGKSPIQALSSVIESSRSPKNNPATKMAAVRMITT